MDNPWVAFCILLVLDYAVIVCIGVPNLSGCGALRHGASSSSTERPTWRELNVIKEENTGGRIETPIALTKLVRLEMSANVSSAIEVSAVIRGCLSNANGCHAADVAPAAVR